MRSAAAWFLSGLLALGALGAPTAPAQSWAAEPAPAVAAPANLDALLAAFRKAPGIEARFTESRHMALLAAPLESAGVIYYAPPGLLARYTAQPNETFQIIEPKRVRFGDATHTETVELAEKPVVRLFVESFVTLVSGDAATLARVYQADFQKVAPAESGRWRLVLRPRPAPLAKVVREIALSGHGLVLDEMRMTEVEGDETLTTFTSVDVARSFSAAEKQRLFRLTGPW